MTERTAAELAAIEAAGGWRSQAPPFVEEVIAQCARLQSVQEALALQLDEREQRHVPRALQECIEARSALRAVLEAARYGDVPQALAIAAEWQVRIARVRQLEDRFDHQEAS